MKYVSLKIICILFLLTAPVSFAGSYIGFTEEGASPGFVLGVLVNIGAYAAVVAVLLMWKWGFWVFVAGLYGGTMLNLAFASPQERAQIDEVGLAPVVAASAIFVSVIVGIFAACTLPHWRNMR